MKKLLFLLLLLLFQEKLFSQSEKDVYTTVLPTKLLEINFVTKANLDSIMIPTNTMFTIIGSTVDSFYITIVPYKKKNVSFSNKMKNVENNEKYVYNYEADYKSAINESRESFDVINGKKNSPIDKTKPALRKVLNELVYEDRKYFKISKDDVKNRCEKYIPFKRIDFSIAPITVPIKIRGGSTNIRKFDFTADANLGLSLGIKIRPTQNDKFYIYPMAGFSITAIDLTTETNYLITKNTKVSAFTPSFSLVFAYDDVQAGVFLGTDYLQGNLNKAWIYENAPWFGIGIGYNIFGSIEKYKAVKTQPGN